MISLRKIFKTNTVPILSKFIFISLKLKCPFHLKINIYYFQMLQTYLYGMLIEKKFSSTPKMNSLT